MVHGPLEKARVKTVEGQGIEVQCLFNPKEYQLQRSNNWGNSDNSTKDAHDLTFSGSSGAKLSMQLFFDTYLGDSSKAGASPQPSDVREYTDKLWQMMNIDPTLRDQKTQKGRPPQVLFLWGQNWLFKAVITSMQQQYTMFTSSGMPVRAMVTVEFQEAQEHRSLMGKGDSGLISSAVRNPALAAALGMIPGAAGMQQALNTASSAVSSVNSAVNAVMAGQDPRNLFR